MDSHCEFGKQRAANKNTLSDTTKMEVMHRWIVCKNEFFVELKKKKSQYYFVAINWKFAYLERKFVSLLTMIELSFFFSSLNILLASIYLSVTAGKMKNIQMWITTTNKYWKTNFPTIYRLKYNQRSITIKANWIITMARKANGILLSSMYWVTPPSPLAA